MEELPDRFSEARSDEVARQLAEPAPSDALRAAIAERVGHYQRWKDRMPATHLFDGVETEGEQAEGDPREGPPLHGDRLGVGASRGVTKARLRVVEDIAGLDRIEPGEILVAQNIDPASRRECASSSTARGGACGWRSSVVVGAATRRSARLAAVGGVWFSSFAAAALLLAAAAAGADGRVYPAAASVEPLAPGARVPSVRVQTVLGEPVDLADLVREQGALLVFYRGGW